MRRCLSVVLGLLIGLWAAWVVHRASAEPPRPDTAGAELNLEHMGRKLTEATGVTWRVSRRERAPGLGPELSGAFSAWHGVSVPYFVLPFGPEEQAKLQLFHRNCSAALEVIAAADGRCVVLAGPSREPDVTAKVLVALGLSGSTEGARWRLAHARAEWLDFRLAVVKPSGAGDDLPMPLADGPTDAQIEDYKELLAAKGPNGGRHRGDPFLWFSRLRFCELPPLLVTTESQHKAHYVLLSDRPEEVLLSRSARPRPWHLRRVYAATDAQGHPAVGIEFDERGARLMGKLTESNIGRPLAVLFHDNVLAVLTIEAKITDRMIIAGGEFDKALVGKIVRSLSECMLAGNREYKRDSLYALLDSPVGQ